MELHVIKRGVDTSLARSLLFHLQSFLSDLALEYPFFCEWLVKVFEELQSTDKRIVVLYCGINIFDIKGVAILKTTDAEKKICTLRVQKAFRNRGIGTILLKKSQELLSEKRPLITVSGFHLKEFTPFLKKNGFVLKDKVKSLYRRGCYEYFFNVAYEHKYVLLSIKPEYATAILKGMKKVEFRKKVFADTVKIAFVYSSFPQKKIIGYFKIVHIEKGTPQEIWDKYSAVGCISKQKFDTYYTGHKFAYGIEISAFGSYDMPLNPYEFNPSFRAPQSYCYVDNIEFLNWLQKNDPARL